MNPTVIVLAAGRGERFLASGGTPAKLQALLGGKPVLQHTLDAVRASGLPWHLQDEPVAGMGDSIALGVRTTAGAAGWLILPGDLPLVLPQTLRAVAAMLRQHAVVVPKVQGQRGHPVGFATLCGGALMNLKGNQGAAQITKAYETFELALNDAGCVSDIDTLDDLQQAEHALHQRREASA